MTGKILGIAKLQGILDRYSSVVYLCWEAASNKFLTCLLRFVPYSIQQPSDRLLFDVFDELDGHQRRECVPITVRN